MQHESPQQPHGLTVAGVYTKFLAWCQRNKSQRTYSLYQLYSDKFQAHLRVGAAQTPPTNPEPASMPADSLRAYHVVEFLELHPTWGANQRRGVIVYVTSPFNWAADLGYPGVAPIRGVKRPPAKKRKGKLTPDGFTLLLSLVSTTDPFRDLIMFAWETGCRPEEARRIESRHLNLDQHRLEIPLEEAKGKRRPRTIYLTEPAEAICRRLLALHPTGKLFRNLAGDPWTVNAVCCRFGRLKAKAGVRFASNDFRHAFATRKLKAGLDPITVANLLGHKNARMLCEFYEEISGDEEHLLRSVRATENR